MCLRNLVGRLGIGDGFCDLRWVMHERDEVREVLCGTETEAERKKNRKRKRRRKRSRQD